MAAMLFTLKSVYRNVHETIICLLDIALYVRQLLGSVKRHPVMALFRIDVNIYYHRFISLLVVQKL